MIASAHKALLWIDGQLGRIAGLFAIAGSIGIITLMGIILIAVFWRYVLNDPLFGIDDISVVVLAVVAACAVAFGARNNAHVSVNIINKFFGRSVTRYTDAIMRLLALGVTAVAAYALSVQACGFDKACITENLSIEHTLFYYVLSASLGFYALHILVQLLVGFIHWNGEDPNEMAD